MPKDGGHSFSRAYDDARKGELSPDSPAAKARARILASSPNTKKFNRKAYEVRDDEGRVFLSIGSRRIIEAPVYSSVVDR